MINWDKPLECEYGDVEYESTNERNTKWVRLDNIEWAVRFDGTPTVHWMPRVYNKKPEPKAGEYWLIKDVNNHERVAYFDGKMFIDGPTCNEAYLDVILIDKMERVEG